MAVGGLGPSERKSNSLRANMTTTLGGMGSSEHVTRDHATRFTFGRRKTRAELKGVEQSAGKHVNEAGRLWRQNPKGVCVHQNKQTGSGIIKTEFSIMMQRTANENAAC